MLQMAPTLPQVVLNRSHNQAEIRGVPIPMEEETTTRITDVSADPEDMAREAEEAISLVQGISRDAIMEVSLGTAALALNHNKALARDPCLKVS